MNDDEDCNIRVICRFRPVNKREIAEGGGIAKQLSFPTDKCVEVAAFNGRPPNTFNFDKVFYDPTTTQKDIYDLAAFQSISDVIKGYNSTIFAYGQTGAGKSFTMFGPDIAEVELKGIIPRACMHIFQHIEQDTEGTEYTIKCSFLEIYKEIVRDLLNPASNGSKGLRVREAPNKGVWVDGLHEAYVTCEEDVLDLLKQGEKHRATASTSMNASSSRSHSLFILTLHQKTRDGSTKEGKLNLADLAGSEKVGKTGATGDTLEEAKKINQSLSALGNCIKALTKSGKQHIPYRDSKLTHILRESLGGNCKSTLLVACSPHIFNLEETISTLMFAKRAKTIKNSVKVNKQRSVEELMGIIEKLKRELIFLKKYVTILEQELEKVKGPNWKDDLPKMPTRTQKPKQTQQSSSTGTKSSNNTSNNNSNEQSSDSSTLLSPRSSSNNNKSSSNDISDDDEEQVFTTSADMSIKLASLQVELKKIKEQSEIDINDLKEEVKSLTLDNESVEKSLHLKKQQIKEYETEIKNLKDELESQQQTKAISEEKLQYDIKQLTLKSEEQISSINELQIHNKEIKDKYNELNQKLEDIISEKERIHRDHDRIQRERDEINEDLKRKIEQINILQENLSQYEISDQNIREENIKLQSDSQALQQKYDSLELKYSNLSTSSRETESKLRITINKKNFLDSRITDLTSDIESLENELSETKNILTKAQEVKNAVQEAGKERIEELLTQTVPLSDYERIIKEKEKYRNNLSSLKSELSKERSSNSLLQSQVEELKVQYKQEIEELQDKFTNENQENHRQIKLLQDKINELKKSKQSKLQSQQSQLDSLISQHQAELLSKQRLEKELEEQYEQNEQTEKSLRRTNTLLEEQKRECKQQVAIIQSQTRSLEAQTERIKRLEHELDESTKDREILQQEIKTALEINIENAKQFEKQLEHIREESPVPKRRQNNIRVPVTQSENRGLFASFFGIKQYPLLGELSNPTKFGYLLKRSQWLKKWEKRWFVLVGEIMYYFETNNQASRASGEIELQGVKVVPAGEFTGRPNTMGLLHRSRKEYYLQAPNEEEHMEWMRVLQLASRKKKILPGNVSNSVPTVKAKEYS